MTEITGSGGMEIDFEILLYCLTGITVAAVAMLVGWHWSVAVLFGFIATGVVAFVCNSGWDL